MFSKLSNLVCAGALAGLLSACGGGHTDQPSAAVASPLASSAGVAAPVSAAAPAVPVSAALAAGVSAAPAQEALPAADVQLAYTAPVTVERHSQISPQSMSSGMSYAQEQAALAAAHQARLAELAAAEQAARWQAAMGNPDDEALLALLMYYENAERQAALSGVRYRKPSDPDCVNPRMMVCAAN